MENNLSYINDKPLRVEFLSQQSLRANKIYMKQKTMSNYFLFLGLDGTTVKSSHQLNKLCLTREIYPQGFSLPLGSKGNKPYMELQGDGLVKLGRAMSCLSLTSNDPHEIECLSTK